MPYFSASVFWSAPARYSLAIAVRSVLVRRRSRAQGLPFDDRGLGWSDAGQGSGFLVAAREQVWDVVCVGVELG